MIVSLPCRKTFLVQYQWIDEKYEIYENTADAPGSKRIVRNVFAQYKDMPFLLCYDEKKKQNEVIPWIFLRAYSCFC